MKIIKSLSKRIQLWGWLIILSTFSAYLYYSNQPINKSQVNIAKGILKENVVLGEQGGDMPSSYARLNIEGIGKIHLKTCSFQKAKYDLLQSLEKNDSIEICFFNDGLITKVCMVKCYQKGQVLSIKDFNKCRASLWKKFSFVALCLLIISISILIRDIFIKT